MFTAIADIVQWYCIECVEFIVVRIRVDIVCGTVLCVKILLVTATVVILQCYCSECGIYCGYSNSIYSAVKP